MGELYAFPRRSVGTRGTSPQMVVVVTWNKFGMHSHAGAWERGIGIGIGIGIGFSISIAISIPIAIALGERKLRYRLVGVL